MRNTPEATSPDVVGDSLVLFNPKRTTTSGVSLIKPETSVLTTSGSRWRDIIVEHHLPDIIGVGEYDYPKQLISVHLGRPAYAEHTAQGHHVRTRFIPGDVTITPPDLYSVGGWEEPGDYLLISLEPAFIERAIAGTIHGNRIEVVPRFPTRDPLIEHLGRALLNATESEPTGNDDLYIESLATALAFHLVRHHATITTDARVLTGGLAKYKLRAPLITSKLTLQPEHRLRRSPRASV